jgi:NTP pyrophosphatase (non-canonical NTP hydrolase)
MTGLLNLRKATGRPYRCSPPSPKKSASYPERLTTEGYKKKREGGDADLGLEVADVLFTLVCIANYYHVDLEQAFKTVMAKYTKRDMDRWTKKKKDSDQNVAEP